MRKTHVMLHHSLTADSGTVSWGAMRDYHRSWRYQGRVITEGEGVQLRAQGFRSVDAPWRDIGYHIGVEKIGDEYEVLLGRPIDEDGAHCKEDGMNQRALGVCFVGDFDADEPSMLMLAAAARHLKPLMAALGIPADAEHVRPHRQHAPYKTCPGAMFPVAHFIAMLGKT